MTVARKERIARNESDFRTLNERLEQSVHRGRPDGGYAGFVCECGEPECDTTIRLKLAAYEEIRSDPRLFFVVPGHEAPDAENVVDRGEHHLVVRKHEDVAAVVDETDPRS